MSKWNSCKSQNTYRGNRKLSKIQFIYLRDGIFVRQVSVKNIPLYLHLVNGQTCNKIK